MTLKERYQYVIDHFVAAQPDAQTELHYDSPFSLLVAVVLSAQCTDKRVNMITPALLEAYPTPEAMARATADDLFPYIRSVSYPNNKAKHLAGLARMLVDEYGGEVPSTHQDLIRLPGVGRKTANVITSVVFEAPAMAVDTHVYRVSRRIGLVPQTARTPLAVERALLRHLPDRYVGRAHHWLILHGRYICVARRPRCGECSLRPACRYYQTLVRRGQALPVVGEMPPPADSPVTFPDGDVPAAPLPQPE